MRVLGLTFVVFALLVMVSCQSSTPLPDKGSAVAQTTADVVDAWDTWCGSFNFEACPVGILESTEGTTMGDLYLGFDFSNDSNVLMEAMGLELQSSVATNPDIDDLLREVLEDVAWFTY